MTELEHAGSTRFKEAHDHGHGAVLVTSNHVLRRTLAVLSGGALLLRLFCA
jgi:hypothetical protein